MIKLPANIDWVNAETSRCAENNKHKNKVKEFRNTKMNPVYMEDS